MDRDRDRDRRPRDFPPEDQYGTGRGQSYRPGGARERTPPPPLARADTYRGRTPPRYRERDIRGGDSFRGRPRSPPPPQPGPRRDELPRDDLFRREPLRDVRPYRDERSFRDGRDYRDERDYARKDGDRGYHNAVTRSPPRFRDRSPIPLKRAREPSPVGSRGRRTPPLKRERLNSRPPRGRYDDFPPTRPQSPPRRRLSPGPRERRLSPPRGIARDHQIRSRSPLVRNERVDPRTTEDWRRPPSRSPQRFARQDNVIEKGGRDNVTTPRPASPPVHPSRLALQQQADDRSRALPSRDPPDSRETRPLASPAPAQREYTNSEGRIPHPREPNRPDDAPASRAPPTAPAGHRVASTGLAPPASAPAPVATPTQVHGRTPAAPPSGPRAGTGPARGDFGTPRGRGGVRGDFGGRGAPGGPFRGGRGGGPAPSSFGRGGGPPPGPSAGFGLARNENFNHDAEYNSATSTPPPPPSGPRGSVSQPQVVPFRQSNNANTATFSRGQRFGSLGQPPIEPAAPTGPRASRHPSGPHPAMADLAKVVDGGQKAEPVVDRARMDKLQEEAEKLRRQIEEREARQRKGLREWARLSRETEAAALRTQLAEEGLRALSGEAESAAAF